MQTPNIALTVAEIISETDDTSTFMLVPADKQPMIYAPGQFLTFLLEINGHEIRRSYSMSSAPGVDACPAVTVRRLINGSVSRFWHDQVTVGTVLHTLPPAGRFTPEASNGDPRDVVLVGAGSGITPLFSMLKFILTNEPQSKVTLVYASRRERSIIFREALQDWHERFPDRLKVIHVLSQPTDEWAGMRGRINNYRLENLVKENLHFARGQAIFMLCGPFEMMRTADITLRFMGFAPHQIRKENFVIDPAPPPPVHSEDRTVQLNFKDKDYHLEIPAYTSILQAGLTHGLPIPYSCRGGSCGTCAALCRTGQIRMSINDVLTTRDLAQGWILTCTAYPESDDVMIEFV